MVEFREAPIDNERVSSHKHRIADYLRPKTLAMLLLGFSSGLPFLLVGNTFGYWLRDEHTSLTAIGFLSWVGIAYSLKFLWAPVMDRVDLPLFKRLGHRRGWMMFSQILVGLALAAMCGTGTKAGLGRLGALALVVAFASSTQDIVVDAWRIDPYRRSNRRLAPVLWYLRRKYGPWNNRDLACKGTAARRCGDE
jgi:PAT family beta-lactamase induction signal transducer AmpG